MTTDAVPGSASTREQIPVVALRLFAEKGYDATSMREIAEQLGMTKAALYYHFDSKEDIVRALLAGMLDQVAELVTWARTQEVTTELRRDVLSRWSDIMQTHGLAMFRFVIANRQVIHEVKPTSQGMEQSVEELCEILTPPGAGTQDKLRVRLALMAINMAGLAGLRIDASDDEVLRAARQISIDLLPTGD